MKVADPDRAVYHGTTGIYVFAALPGGKRDTYDIAELEPASLLAFLRSQGGCNVMAENTIGILLGHGRIVPTDGPVELQASKA